MEAHAAVGTVDRRALLYIVGLRDVCQLDYYRN